MYLENQNTRENRGMEILEQKHKLFEKFRMTFKEMKIYSEEEMERKSEIINEMELVDQEYIAWRRKTS